jgi:hypothetical protein
MIKLEFLENAETGISLSQIPGIQYPASSIEAYSHAAYKGPVGTYSR